MTNQERRRVQRGKSGYAPAARRRRTNSRPNKPPASNVKEAGSGTAAIGVCAKRTVMLSRSTSSVFGPCPKTVTVRLVVAGNDAELGLKMSGVPTIFNDIPFDNVSLAVVTPG